MHDLIRLSRSSLGSDEKQAVCQVIDDGYLGMGEQVKLFEQELETFFSHKTHVVCVNTGTSALHLALQACNIQRGDEVLIPSITYVASFQATSATGAVPIACDIDLKTGCLNTQDMKKKITDKTKAIMHVHYAGGVGDRQSVFAFAQEHDLRVIEDAAHAFGGYHANQRIGQTGDVTCFSFDGIKNITCGEGGAIVSSDLSIIEKVRDLRLLGVQKDSDKRYAGQRSWDFDVVEQGWRYHMSNINAAIGRVQLKKIDLFSKKRQNLAKMYSQSLSNLPINFLDLDFDNIVPHIFPIFVNEGKRDELKKFLLENNIETGIHYKPNHLLSKYKGSSCPNSEDFGKSILSLPLHFILKESDIQQVTNLIRKFFS